jgi:hypothetical protein
MTFFTLGLVSAALFLLVAVAWLVVLERERRRHCGVRDEIGRLRRKAERLKAFKS